MVVLPDAFDQERSIKGDERWTKADDEGKAQAEQLFTLLAVTHRDYAPLFSPNVLPGGQSQGMAGITQSILYNANPQQPRTGSTERQPTIGWDTLNWDTESAAVPEWGATASIQATRWPWQLMSGLNSAPRVKLNWQPKLTPITGGRLKVAAEQLDDEMQEAAEFAAEHERLISH